MPTSDGPAKRAPKKATSIPISAPAQVEDSPGEASIPIQASTKAGDSSRERVSTWTRIVIAMSASAPVASALANFGTFVAAIIVVIVFFSKDLERENGRLTNEKVALTNEKLRLERDARILGQDVVGLRADRRGIMGDLDRTREAQKLLKEDMGALDSLLDARRREATDTRAKIETLRGDLDRLTVVNDEMGRSTDQMSDRLFPMMVANYVANLHPTLEDTLSVPYFAFLYDPDDPGFRVVSGDEISNFMFVVISEYERKQDNISIANTCPMDDGVYLTGLVTKYNRNGTVSSFMLNTKSSIVFENMCKILSSEHFVVLPGEKLRDQRLMKVYKILAGGSDISPFFSFYPGSFDGTPFEEASLRALWVPMIDQLYGKEIQGFVDRTFGAQSEPLAARTLFTTGAMSFSVSRDRQTISDAAEKDFRSRGFRRLAEQAREFDDQWIKYVGLAGVYVGGGRKRLVNDGEFVTIVPRLGANDILTDRFFQDLTSLKDFQLQTMCLATVFSASREYVSKALLSEYVTCMLQDRMRASMAARFEQLRTLRSPLVH